jgi:hypothetical protein
VTTLLGKLTSLYAGTRLNDVNFSLFHENSRVANHGSEKAQIYKIWNFGNLEFSTLFQPNLHTSFEQADSIQLG